MAETRAYDGYSTRPHTYSSSIGSLSDGAGGTSHSVSRPFGGGSK
jgi:hypothetical protein